jgi:hypothetical protein
VNVKEGVMERAREKVVEKVREEVMERAREEVKEVVEKEKREKVKEMAMRRRVATVFGASQPTLALGRQTSNCHAGQD